MGSLILPSVFITPGSVAIGKIQEQIFESFDEIQRREQCCLTLKLSSRLWHSSQNI